MRKGKVFILTYLLCVLLVTVCFAEEVIPSIDNAAAQGPIRKLGRGLQNISIGGPLQFFKDIEDTYKQDGIIAAGSAGAIKGLVKGVARFCVGVYETLTFIIPGPEHYKPIMNDPEFFIQTDPEFPELGPTDQRP